MKKSTFFKLLVTWAILSFVLLSCNNADHTDGNLPQDSQQHVSHELASEAPSDPHDIYRQLVSSFEMPKLSIGETVRLQSDTPLYTTPAFDASSIRNLQNVEVTIEDFDHFFAKVRTVSFTNNQTGWIPLWSLYPGSREMDFYRGNRLKMANKDTAMQLMPLDGMGLTDITLKANQPVTVRRMTSDYFEVSIIDEAGKRQDALWMKKSDLKSFDPDQVVQGIVRGGAKIQMEHNETTITEKPIYVWILGEQDEAATVRLPDHKQGEVGKADLIKDPFAPLHTYESSEGFLFWSEQYAPESVGDPFVFRIYANQAMDQASVENSVRNSLHVNEAKIASLQHDQSDEAKISGLQHDPSERVTVAFRWISDRDVFLYVSGLAETDAVMFDLFDASTADGNKLGTALNVIRAKFEADILPQETTYIHQTSVGQLQTESLKLPSFFDYRFSLDDEHENKIILITDNEASYTLVDLPTLKTDEVPKLSKLLEQQTERGIPEIPADRLGEDAAYVLVDGDELYHFHFSEGTWTKVYASERVIFGFAVSPDMEQVALLVSQSEYAVTPADLVIIDTKGNPQFEAERKAQISASDGVYSIYGIRFVDNHTVAFPTEYRVEGQNANAYGEAFVDIGTGATSYVPAHFAELDLERSVLKLSDDLEIPLSERWLSQLATRYDHERMTYDWSPDREHFILSVAGQLYMYEVGANEWRWIGKGTFVKWMDGQTFVWMQGYSPYFIF